MKPRFPPHKNTNRMDFRSYYWLYHFLLKRHQKPSRAITQHDNDTLTYRKIFPMIQSLTGRLHVEDKANRTNLRLISDIISLLYHKNVLDKHEEKQIIDSTKRGL